ncbi:transposable element Tcb2 transposase [Trichonephila clavipes]|nr:transposable element Tcb2 transposase [Trichonephila clavipes]
MSQQRDLPESMVWRVVGRLESGKHNVVSRTLLKSPEVLLQSCGIDSKKQEVLDVDQEQAYNARPHIARLVENMLEAETIQRMEWPACSPDLNPIGHVWDILGRRIAARPRPPATVRDLEIALLEE